MNAKIKSEMVNQWLRKPALPSNTEQAGPAERCIYKNGQIYGKSGGGKIPE